MFTSFLKKLTSKTLGENLNQSNLSLDPVEEPASTLRKKLEKITGGKIMRK